MKKTKVDEIFGNGRLFATTEALPGETAQMILAGFDRPDDLIILQLTSSLYFIYPKSKRRELKKAINEALKAKQINPQNFVGFLL